MTDPAFERYREALRQGHLAALRSDDVAAAAAYGEAAALAPGRPLPLVGLGSALAALGRRAEALAAFDRALQLAPLDEAALRGRGDALVALGRNAEAAAALTGLAESLAADGRHGEALELARQALALEAAAARFRLVASLAAAVRASGAAPAGTEAATLDNAGSPGDEGTPGQAADRREPAGGQGRSRRPAPPAGATLAAEADALVDDGRAVEARERYLMAARAYRDSGQRLAALDACYRALAIAPADPDLHLALAELYAERGWREPAVDKLLLLVRLLELEGDTEARERVCNLVAGRFPDEPRLAAVCR